MPAGRWRHVEILESQHRTSATRHKPAGQLLRHRLTPHHPPHAAQLLSTETAVLAEPTGHPCQRPIGDRARQPRSETPIGDLCPAVVEHHREVLGLGVESIGIGSHRLRHSGEARRQLRVEAEQLRKDPQPDHIAG